jgi:hypothetical protein
LQFSVSGDRLAGAFSADRWQSRACSERSDRALPGYLRLSAQWNAAGQPELKKNFHLSSISFRLHFFIICLFVVWLCYSFLAFICLSPFMIFYVPISLSAAGS